MKIYVFIIVGILLIGLVYAGCTGTATACTSLTSPACSGQDGCTDEGTCDGAGSLPCAAIPVDYCTLFAECGLVGESCAGGTGYCSDLDGEYVACNYLEGLGECSWTDDCTGTATACTGLTPAQCGLDTSFAQYGCYYFGCEYSGAGDWVINTETMGSCTINKSAFLPDNTLYIIGDGGLVQLKANVTAEKVVIHIGVGFSNPIGDNQRIILHL